jgi:hypothetical protein
MKLLFQAKPPQGTMYGRWGVHSVTIFIKNDIFTVSGKLLQTRMTKQHLKHVEAIYGFTATCATVHFEQVDILRLTVGSEDC